jgi:hypothetical protein
MWKYKESTIQSIADAPEGAFGFIYKITHISTGKFYIGKKQLFSERNIKLGKKELQEQSLLKKPGRKPTKKLVKKESDWHKYWGSSEELLLDLKTYGENQFIREILIFTYGKKQNTYYEIKYQFMEGVLESDNSYNSNINSTFFRKDLIQ